MKGRQKMDHVKRAQELHQKKYNCAQAVAGAFCDKTWISLDDTARLASSFGGGMGGLREVCGAVSGALLVLGCVKGYDVPGDQDIKKAHYDRVKDFVERFREKHGTILCRELLEGTMPPGMTPEEGTAKGLKPRPCPGLVMDAAAILEEMLADEEP